MASKRAALFVGSVAGFVLNSNGFTAASDTVPRVAAAISGSAGGANQLLRVHGEALAEKVGDAAFGYAGRIIHAIPNVPYYASQAAQSKAALGIIKLQALASVCIDAIRTVSGASDFYQSCMTPDCSFQVALVNVAQNSTKVITAGSSLLRQNETMNRIGEICMGMMHNGTQNLILHLSSLNM